MAPRIAMIVPLALSFILAPWSVPSAIAHYCEAHDPALNCGDCTSGDHEHYRIYPGDPNHYVYCVSEDGDCTLTTDEPEIATPSSVGVYYVDVDLQERNVDVFEESNGIDGLQREERCGVPGDLRIF